MKGRLVGAAAKPMRGEDTGKERYACLWFPGSFSGGIMAVTRFHIGITNPKEIIPRLAKKDGDWKEGYSAAELAHAWIDAAGFPPSVRRVLGQLGRLPRRRAVGRNLRA